MSRLTVLENHLSPQEALTLVQALSIAQDPNVTALCDSMIRAAQSSGDDQDVNRIRREIDASIQAGRDLALAIPHPLAQQRNGNGNGNDIAPALDNSRMLSVTSITSAQLNELRVCDLISLEITAVEVRKSRSTPSPSPPSPATCLCMYVVYRMFQKLKSHHVYVINVTCRRNSPWQVSPSR